MLSQVIDIVATMAVLAVAAGGMLALASSFVLPFLPRNWHKDHATDSARMRDLASSAEARRSGARDAGELPTGPQPRL